jgi:hypothetical protein
MSLRNPEEYSEQPFIAPKEERIWQLLNAIFDIVHSSEKEILEMKKRNYVCIFTFISR